MDSTTKCQYLLCDETAQLIFENRVYCGKHWIAKQPKKLQLQFLEHQNKTRKDKSLGN